MTAYIHATEVTLTDGISLLSSLTASAHGLVMALLLHVLIVCIRNTEVALSAYLWHHRTRPGADPRLVLQRRCMYRQRTQKALGHTAHRGWARLLLNRARDLITHGPAHRGANGAAMPTDEGDQDGHFFFNHPERGGYSAA